MTLVLYIFTPLCRCAVEQYLSARSEDQIFCHIDTILPYNDVKKSNKSSGKQIVDRKVASYKLQVASCGLLVAC